MARLRERYGTGLLLVPLPGRLQVLVLLAADAARVLRDTPDPFSPVNDEKRRVLANFEPAVSLVSAGEARARRPHLNEAMLDTRRAVHSTAATLPAILAA
jgi:hypothetical protein